MYLKKVVHNIVKTSFIKLISLIDFLLALGNSASPLGSVYLGIEIIDIILEDNQQRNDILYFWLHFRCYNIISDVYIRFLINKGTLNVIYT